MFSSKVLVVVAAIATLTLGCKDEYEGPRTDSGFSASTDGGGGGFPGTCSEVGSISSPGIQSGNTSGRGNYFDAPCGGSGGPEDIWSLYLSVPSFVTVEVVDASFDTVVYLRPASCSGSDYLSCDDDGGEGTLSRLEADLSEGHYYLVVDGYDSGDSGSYTLQVSY